MINDQSMVLRLLLSALLGSLIGFERERLNWAAGLRTHMLVAVGSTLFLLVSAYGFHDLPNRPQDRRESPLKLSAVSVFWEPER